MCYCCCCYEGWAVALLRESPLVRRRRCLRRGVLSSCLKTRLRAAVVGGSRRRLAAQLLACRLLSLRPCWRRWSEALRARCCLVAATTRSFARRGRRGSWSRKGWRASCFSRVRGRVLLVLAARALSPFLPSLVAGTRRRWWASERSLEKLAEQSSEVRSRRSSSADLPRLWVWTRTSRPPSFWVSSRRRVWALERSSSSLRSSWSPSLLRVCFWLSSRAVRSRLRLRLGLPGRQRLVVACADDHENAFGPALLPLFRLCLFLQFSGRCCS